MTVEQQGLRASCLGQGWWREQRRGGGFATSYIHTKALLAPLQRSRVTCGSVWRRIHYMILMIFSEEERGPLVFIWLLSFCFLPCISSPFLWAFLRYPFSQITPSNGGCAVVVTPPLTLKPLYESRSRTRGRFVGLSASSLNSCVTLGKSLKLTESQLPYPKNISFKWVLCGCATGLALRRCSTDYIGWVRKTTVYSHSQPGEEPLSFSPFIFSQTPSLFLEKKKSKVYWNFKLHLKNQNPNPADIHQDKVSESGKYSLSQNPLETSSLGRSHWIKAILLSIPCLQQDTIVLLTLKFSKSIKKIK